MRLHGVGDAAAAAGAELVARLNADLGHGTVKLIKVLGPAAPARAYGRLRAPGSRGPGDTYG